MSLNNENASSLTAEALPRLSITYLLLATAAVAADLGLGRALSDVESNFPNRWLLHLAWATGSVVTALGIQILIWEGIRRVQGKQTILLEPGAKYAAIMGWLGIFSLIYFVCFRTVGWQSAPSFKIYLLLSTLFECVSLAIALLGLYWIRGFTWRTLLSAQAAMSFHTLLQNFVHLAIGLSGSSFFSVLSNGSLVLVGAFYGVGLIALALSLIRDWRTKTQRHFTHYLGAVLFCLSLFSTVCTYAWQFTMNGW